MTQVERMKIFKKAWKESIVTSVYPEHPEGAAIGNAAFLFSISKQLFPDNNLAHQINLANLERHLGDIRSIRHDMIHLIGQQIYYFTEANDIKECEAGSTFFYMQGENSRLLKKTGLRLNTGIHLGDGYWLENSMGSSFTWDKYKYDNEFEPRLIFGGRFNYNPTVHVDNVYSRPNNLGDNNDEVVWRDFWDGICP
jgi:hypothetical protein